MGSQSRVDGFAFEREHAEHSLVHRVRGFLRTNRSRMTTGVWGTSTVTDDDMAGGSGLGLAIGCAVNLAIPRRDLERT
jgi:hypothetical protein